jgi:predicted RNA methylase
MNYNNIKLSRYVDDFLVDNINNMTCDFNDISESEITCHVDKLSIDQYFPKHNNINYTKLQIDEVGKYSITLPKKADVISKIIQSYCSNDQERITITDATAGVGGNVLSFCKFGFIVNAIEIDKERCDILKNNITEYNYKVNVINNNYLDIYEKLKQDVIFVDPPWGGIDYKKAEEITLKLGEVTVEDLCNRINKKKLSKLTVLKLPFNYNLNYIKREVHLPFTIVKLKNILLFIIFNAL